ncbi:MAG: MFS transporter, partial [Candidatus Thermochlorobacter sp.]
VSLITSSIESRYRGSFMSINACVQQLSSGLASFLAGLVIGKGEGSALTNYWLVGIAASAATLLCIAFVEWIKLAEAPIARMEPKVASLAESSL